MSAPRMPVGFRLWVGATFGSELGAGVLGFALTWAGSGHGPHTASLLLTLTVAPSVLLGLVGGAVADRHGPQRVLRVTSIATMALATLLALAVTAGADAPPTLFAAAVGIGSISAFSRPAAGVFPRLFAAEGELGTAMVRAGLATQLARTIGPPLGGVLIGAVTLGGVAVVDALGAAVMLAVLVVARPPIPRPTAQAPVRLSGILEALRTARGTPGVPALLGGVMVIAGAVIPAVTLGVPLAARERGWPASQAGVIEMGWIAGGIVVSAWFAWRGTRARAWRPMAAGPVAVCAGLCLLAVAPTWRAAAVATIVVGLGVVVFTAHAFPTYVLLAPESMVSRFQSLLILVQMAPQLVVNPLIGAFVSGIGAGWVIGAAGVLALLATVVVARDRALRGLTADSEPAPG